MLVTWKVPFMVCEPLAPVKLKDSSWWLAGWAWLVWFVCSIPPVFFDAQLPAYCRTAFLIMILPQCHWDSVYHQAGDIILYAIYLCHMAHTNYMPYTCAIWQIPTSQPLMYLYRRVFFFVQNALFKTRSSKRPADIASQTRPNSCNYAGAGDSSAVAGHLQSFQSPASKQPLSNLHR